MLNKQQDPVEEIRANYYKKTEESNKALVNHIFIADEIIISLLFKPIFLIILGK